MFFQTIYPMLSAGTDLSINIRRVNDNLSVAVMPRHAGVKDETQQNLVPPILNGTPGELDAEFLQTITVPVSQALGVLTNLETFEKQTEKATAESKAAKKTAAEKESKEAREKREKMEKLLKKADEATTARKYSAALIWLKQVRILAPADKQKEIDTRMQKVQKQADAGSLFAVQSLEPQPVTHPAAQPQPAARPQSVPPAAPNGRETAPAAQPQDGQMQMFTQQPTVTAPASAPTAQPVPQEMGSMPRGNYPQRWPTAQSGYVQPE